MTVMVMVAARMSALILPLVMVGRLCIVPGLIVRMVGMGRRIGHVSAPVFGLRFRFLIAASHATIPFASKELTPK
jgi:hypothetical protein